MPGEMFRLRYDVKMSAEDSESAEVMIYGEICTEGWKLLKSDVSAMDFDKALKDAKSAGAKKMHVRINSPGGDVNEAIAMRTMLAGCGMDDVTIDIEGMCASAATLLACVPNARVRMAEGSEYMIHNPTCMAWGQAKDLESVVQRLRNTEAEAASIYAKKTGQSEEEIRGWMDAETWMTANEAKERGFVDEVLESAPIVASASPKMLSAMRMMYGHVPEAIREEPEQDEIDSAEGQEPPAPEDNKDEGETGMDLKDLTMEALQSGNAELYEQLIKTGAEQERERISEIDELTPPGEEYEQMAAEAKASGMSALEFHKALVKHQKEKGKKFLEQRKEETAAASKVLGQDMKDNDVGSDEKELDAYAKEMAEIAKQARADSHGNMF